VLKRDEIEQSKTRFELIRMILILKIPLWDRLFGLWFSCRGTCWIICYSVVKTKIIFPVWKKQLIMC